MCRISDWRKNIYDKLTILGEQSHEQSIQDKLQLTKPFYHFIRKLPITAGCQLPANTVAEMSKLLPAVQLWLVSSPEQYKKHHINCQKSKDTQHICNLSYRYNHTHTHTRLTALLPGLSEWAGTRKVKPIWILLKQDSEWQWHQLGHMQVCTSNQTDNHASTPPLWFYRPDALPAAQPTASKHWRQATDTISHLNRYSFDVLKITKYWQLIKPKYWDTKSYTMQPHHQTYKLVIQANPIQ